MSTCISIIAGCLSSFFHDNLFRYRKFSALISHTILLRKPVLVIYLTPASILKDSPPSFHWPHATCFIVCCCFHQGGLLWVHIADTSELWYPKLYWIYQHLFQNCTSWVVPETSRPWDANTMDQPNKPLYPKFMWYQANSGKTHWVMWILFLLASIYTWLMVRGSDQNWETGLNSTRKETEFPPRHLEHPSRSCPINSLCYA